MPYSYFSVLDNSCLFDLEAYRFTVTSLLGDLSEENKVTAYAFTISTLTLQGVLEGKYVLTFSCTLLNKQFLVCSDLYKVMEHL